MPLEFWFTKKTQGENGKIVPRAQINDEFCWILGIEPNKDRFDPNWMNVEEAIVFGVFGQNRASSCDIDWEKIRQRVLNSVDQEKKTKKQKRDRVRLDAAFRYLAATYEVHMYRSHGKIH